MADNSKTLDLFTTRMRQMILLYKDKVKEIDDLYTMVEQQEEQIKMLEAKIAQQERDYNSLKMAKMLTVTDGDIEGAKKRIQHVINDINKCITLLSDKE